MEISEIIAGAAGLAVALSGLYWAFRKIMKVVGKLWPGEDPVEKADQWLAEHLDEEVRDLEEQLDLPFDGPSK